ncbi:MAG TPA: hypothetical protein VI997_04925 [Candidatus Thermoplasmatota archaeon]|nr:hypothetical protein [Candidatus Thermoplasmatota archaeon]
MADEPVRVETRKPSWLERMRASAEAGRERLEEVAQTRGYSSYAAMRDTQRMKKHGYRWCPGCGMNVRPQAPWGFTRIVTLSLSRPGKRECPRCRGTLFAPPRE